MPINLPSNALQFSLLIFCAFPYRHPFGTCPIHGNILDFMTLLTVPEEQLQIIMSIYESFSSFQSLSPPS